MGLKENYKCTYAPKPKGNIKPHKRPHLHTRSINPLKVPTTLIKGLIRQHKRPFLNMFWSTGYITLCPLSSKNHLTNTKIYIISIIIETLKSSRYDIVF